MRATRDRAALAAADHDFHETLAEIAGNALLVDLLHIARSLLQVDADRAVQVRTNALLAVEKHTANCVAPARRDANAAASARAAHMATAAACVRAEHSK